jgi:hypothetical protein
MTREERHIDYDERIDRYLRGRMDDQERAAFEQEVDGDKELRQRLVATARLAMGIAQEGMRREGQAQLDTIKQMSKEEFIAATRGKGNNRKMWWSVARWAAAIAAVAILVFCLPLFRPASETPIPNTVEMVNKQKAVQPKVPKKPEKPTLASLAEEYSRPFVSEPDAFVEIRQQIKQEDYHYMMAVVYDIDKIEWPTAKHGPKGADDDEVAKETIDNYADCIHWYKALAYLKAGDKESAVRELTALKKQGKNEELVKRATDLLKKLGH